MKCNIRPTTLAIAFAAASVLSIVSRAEGQQCSLASAAGRYAFTLTGNLLSPTGWVPAAAVGRFTIDLEGNVSGTEARNVGGGFANETLRGTLTVNANCTGRVAFDIFESGVLVRKTVFSTVTDDNFTEIRSVEQSLILEPSGTHVPAVITTVVKRLF
jgi:hypothetical protein